MQQCVSEMGLKRWRLWLPRPRCAKSCFTEILKRAWALGCLSPRCMLNHWRAIGLSLHEKVLSTSTLEKTFKKKAIQYINKCDSAEYVSKNKSVHLWALRMLQCHSDLTAPVSVKPPAHAYYSTVAVRKWLFILFSLCYSLNALVFRAELGYVKNKHID